MSTIGTPPIISPLEGLVMSEHYGTAAEGDVEITISRSLTGTTFYADAHRRSSDDSPDKLLRREQMNIQPSLTAWLQGMIERVNA